MFSSHVSVQGTVIRRTREDCLSLQLRSFSQADTGVQKGRRVSVRPSGVTVLRVRQKSSEPEVIIPRTLTSSRSGKMPPKELQCVYDVKVR